MKALAGRFRRQKLGPSTTLLVDETRAWSAPITGMESSERQLGRADAIAEAMRVMRRLGLEPRGPLDAGDLVRFVYAQGWLACEARLASTDMADAIDDALNHPGHVTDKTSTDTINTWTVRALQQTVIREAGKAHS